MRTWPFALWCGVGTLAATPALGQEEPLGPDSIVEIAPAPPAVNAPVGADSMGLEEPPPARPRSRGLVVESTLGVLGFGGQFRHVAPLASHIRAQLGYELFSWLMIFGDGELAFTDTSESQDPSHSRAFPIWGLGGGARGSMRVGSIGCFVEAELGALTARVPHGALADLGFRSAESLAPQYGVRLGVEWYQKDRHLALTVEGGPRIAQGFAKAGSPSDIPLMWDASAGLRYTF